MAVALGFSIGFWAIFGLVLYGLWRFYKYRKLVNKIPGPRSYWGVGNLHQFKTDPVDWLEQTEGVVKGIIHKLRDTCSQDHPKVFNKIGMMRIWLSVFPFLCVFRAEEAEAILTSTKHINKGLEYSMLIPWMGLGLLTSYGEKWRSRRKLLTPTFHSDILKDFVKVFNREAKILVKNLEKRCREGPLDLFPYITNCALDIICETAMRRTVNAQGNKESDYVKATYRINDLIHDRQRKPWFWPNFTYWYFGDGKEFQWCLDVVHGFAQNVIDERLEEIKKYGPRKTNVNGNGKQRLGFLDLLLEMVEQGKMPMEDVRPEVDTFMFGGHDTTSAAMNWALFLIGLHPDIQAKIQLEVDSVVAEKDSFSGELTIEDLKKMEYLECCLKESLRIYPSVPAFSRTLKGDITIRGYTIPKSMEVMIWPHLIHRDERYWPNPEVFDPDRFLPGNSVGRHPFAFLPFSAGPRNCLGQRFAFLEEKTVLWWVLRNFTVRSLNRRDQVRAKPQIILRPAEGIMMELTPREHCKTIPCRQENVAFA